MTSCNDKCPSNITYDHTLLQLLSSNHKMIFYFEKKNTENHLFLRFIITSGCSMDVFSYNVYSVEQKHTHLFGHTS